MSIRHHRFLPGQSDRRVSSERYLVLLPDIDGRSDQEDLYHQLDYNAFIIPFPACIFAATARSPILSAHIHDSKHTICGERRPLDERLVCVVRFVP